MTDKTIDALAQAARATYVQAKGIPEKQVLPWDRPPDRDGLPQTHKDAWHIVAACVIDGNATPWDAWQTYVQMVGAQSYAMPWEASSEPHRNAWAAVVEAVRDTAKKEMDSR